MPPTASTKRARKKTRAAATTTGAGENPAAASTPGRIALPERADEIPERVWTAAALGVLLVAAVLRLYAPDLNPLHHDEGVNGFFLTNLLRKGIYKYDPGNYHGPTLYYLTVPSTVLFGLNTFAVRFIPALAGIATVWLALCLRSRLGRTGALAAAALLAVSPGAVYNSRYFIHESLFVFFTTALVVAVLRFYDTGRPSYLMLAAASAALLFATKETAFISVIVLLLATGIAWGYARLVRQPGWTWDAVAGGDAPASKRDERAGRATLEEDNPVDRLSLAPLLAGAAALFIVIYVLFYSSFFTNPEGIADSLQTFEIWTRTAEKDHLKPFDTYLGWLEQEEAPIYFLAIIGAVWAVFGDARNRFAVFAGAWAFGLLLAYSIVKYKTPWLMLNFTVPMALAGGYAVGAMGETARRIAPRLLRMWAALSLAATIVAAYAFLYSDYYKAAGQPNREALLFLSAFVVTAIGAWAFAAFSDKPGNLLRGHTPALALTAVAVAVCAYQTIVLNFQQYDNEQYPYVYAHTQRGTLELVREVERLAARARTGTGTGISIAAPEYWPLPWYFRDYTGAGFNGQALPSYNANQTPIVIGRDSQAAQLRAVLGTGYRQVGDVYALRPGVKLILFARSDLVGP